MEETTSLFSHKLQNEKLHMLHMRKKKSLQWRLRCDYDYKNREGSREMCLRVQILMQWRSKKEIERSAPGKTCFPVLEVAAFFDGVFMLMAKRGNNLGSKCSSYSTELMWLLDYTKSLIRAISSSSSSSFILSYTICDVGFLPQLTGVKVVWGLLLLLPQ